MNRILRLLRHALAALVLAVGLMPAAQAADAVASNTWTASGGDLGFIWNQDLLADLGMALDDERGIGQPDARGFVAVPLRSQGGLQFAVDAGNFERFVGGRLALRGGFRLRTHDGALSLIDASLQPRGADSQTLDLVDADGHAWFFLDRLMYAISADGRQLQVRTMDLRIHDALARRIGKPQVAGWAIAQLWVFWVMPIVGAVLAGWVSRVLFDSADKPDVEGDVRRGT